MSILSDVGRSMMGCGCFIMLLLLLLPFASFLGPVALIGLGAFVVVMFVVGLVEAAKKPRPEK